jgi:hypothetical protein
MHIEQLELGGHWDPTPILELSHKLCVAKGGKYPGPQGIKVFV